MFLLIDKPKGITSHDVVDRVRKITGERKVGHAGTLDPNATGLLVIGIGRESTKKLGNISKDTTKTYEAEIIFGEERDTDDVEGKILRQTQDDKSSLRDLPDLSNTAVEKVLERFIGEQEQIPPEYSAIKLNGKKAYQLARKGKSVNLEPRSIVIYSIKLLSYKYPKLKIVTKVSSGTYIRALARDIGRVLRVGAYLNELKRVEIGEYHLKDAVKLQKVTVVNWKEYALS